MEENLKKILRDMQNKEDMRKNVINEINAEISRVDLKQKTEMDRFIQGINEDIDAGLYNNRTDGQMQKVIDEETDKIKEKYNSEKLEINNKLGETQKQQEKEKENDYREISSAIKEYHLDMVLEVNRANNELRILENERNEKLKEIDEQISRKEAEQTQLIMKNRNFMDIEQSDASIDIRALEQEIEELKLSRTGLEKEYSVKLKEKSDNIKQYNEQKDRASKFISSIRLSEKTIDEIYELLFDEKDINREEEKTQKESDNGDKEEPMPSELDNEDKEEPMPSELDNEDKEEEPILSEPDNEDKEEIVSSELNNETTGKVKISNSSKTTNKINKKFSYEFSMKKGIKYDGKDIDIDDLLIWYDENANNIENAIIEAIGDNEDTEWFLIHSDKLIYSTIIFAGAKTESDGKITLDEDSKRRLQTYYDMWNNPKSQEDCDMNIKYNLKGMSKLQRFFKGSQLREEEALDIKRNAFLLRNRKNVEIEKSFMTSIYYKMMDKIEGIRNVKKIEAKTGEETSPKKSNNTRQSFMDRLNPKNAEYEQLDNSTNEKLEKTAEKESSDLSRDEDDYLF